MKNTQDGVSFLSWTFCVMYLAALQDPDRELEN